ncbi:hypothetical protein T492DRAFT_454392 [Pavlovales sp. CCMP2436]|nr:hypothetical protein T492DRAFT_454392 [Pavlovales sp. CCMP2436]
MADATAMNPGDPTASGTQLRRGGATQKAFAFPTPMSPFPASEFAPPSSAFDTPGLPPTARLWRDEGLGGGSGKRRRNPPKWLVEEEEKPQFDTSRAGKRPKQPPEPAAAGGFPLGVDWQLSEGGRQFGAERQAVAARGGGVGRERGGEGRGGKHIRQGRWPSAEGLELELGLNDSDFTSELLNFGAQNFGELGAPPAVATPQWRAVALGGGAEEEHSSSDESEDNTDDGAYAIRHENSNERLSRGGAKGGGNGGGKSGPRHAKSIPRHAQWGLPLALPESSPGAEGSTPPWARERAEGPRRARKVDQGKKVLAAPVPRAPAGYREVVAGGCFAAEVGSYREVWCLAGALRRIWVVALALALVH